MALLKSTDAKVVGITFKNSDGTDRQEILSFVSDGDPVTVQYSDSVTERSFCRLYFAYSS